MCIPLTRELRAFHGAWATPRSSRILEKTERSSARSICRGLVPRIFTPFKCKGIARLLGIWPPTDTMLPEQPCWGEERMCKIKRGEIAGIITEQEEKGREKTGEGQILCQFLDLLSQGYRPRFTVWNLQPVPIILATDHTVKIWNKQKQLILVMP